MASIRKRGKLWQAQVRRKSAPSLYQSFLTKAEAQAWSREAEVSLDREVLPAKPEVPERFTLGNLLRRYLREAVPHKKGHVTETYRINLLLR